MFSVPQSCPSDVELAAFFDAGIVGARVEEIRDHIDDCSECSSSLVALLGGSQLGGLARPSIELGDIAAGTRVGPFELRALLGAGNLGRVYAAFDSRLERTIALKLLGVRRDHPSWTERLVSEAQTMARIRHPNVCTVHEVGRDGELVYIAMEKISGETLREASSSEWKARELVRVLRDAARGLASAHEQGVVHRDFKPDNVMIEALGGVPRVVVCDFGLAAAGSLAIETDGGATRPGTVSGLVGSPAYMAPEQLDGAEVGPAADVWAFGVTAWELACGERPFQGDTLEALRAAHKTPPVWRGRNHVTTAVRRLISRCLAESPSERPASMAQVASLLEAELGRASRRRPARLAALGVALALGAFAGGGWWMLERARASTSPLPSACAPLDEAGWPMPKGSWIASAKSAALPPWLIADVTGAIDSRASAWQTQQRAFCSPRAPDAVGASLWAECRRSQARTSAIFLDVLTSAKWPSFEAAGRAIDELPPVSFCATAEGLQAAVTSARGIGSVGSGDRAAGSGDRAAVRELLARATFLARGAASEPAWSDTLASAIARSAEAGQAKDGALAADVAFVTADLQPASSSAERDQQWRRAVALAEASGNQFIGARAWLELIDLWTDTEPTDRRATLAIEQADWAITRLGDPPRLRSTWHRATGSHAWRTGDYGGARAHLSQAIEAAGDDPVAGRSVSHVLARLASMDEDHARARALFEEVLADSRTEATSATSRARLYSAYAEVLYQLDELDGGLAAIGSALRLANEALGPSDPVVGTYTLVRGMLELEKGDTAGCLASVEAALASLTDAYGDAHSSVGAAYNLRASAEAANGDHEEALATARQARSVYVGLYGPRHESSIFASQLVAENLRATGKLAESRVVFEETLELAEETLGAANSYATHLRASLAGVLDALGQETRAIELGEAALAATRNGQETPPYVGQAEHQLAVILADSNPRRARALAASAVENYGDSPYWSKERAQAGALVKSLRRVSTQR